MPRLELHGVGRTYAEDPPIAALSGVTLAIDQGEFLAIEGPSGSGKSTLLNLIALIDRPTAGTYTIEGVDTAALDEEERAQVRGRSFGFIFQSFHLIPGNYVAAARTAEWPVTPSVSGIEQGGPGAARTARGLTPERTGLPDAGQGYPACVAGP